MKGRPHSAEHNRKVWEAVKDKLGDGFLKSQGRFRKEVGTASEAARVADIKRWSNPKLAEPILKKIIESIHASPNKAESYLQSLLDHSFPSQWKFVGNGEVIIGSKNPDFININGKKQVIELFGVYWHPLFDAAKRMAHFQQYGFSTLIIWEDELKNKDVVIKKIKSFMRRKTHARS